MLTTTTIRPSFHIPTTLSATTIMYLKRSIYVVLLIVVCYCCWGDYDVNEYNDKDDSDDVFNGGRVGTLSSMIISKMLNLPLPSPPTYFIINRIIPGANAASIISNWYTYCALGCTVSNGGLVLDGQAMTNDAVSNGEITAIYFNSNFLVKGTITIKTNAAVMNVTLQRFTSDINSGDSVVEVVSGVMAAGCSITIQDATVLDTDQQRAILDFISGTFIMSGNAVVILRNLRLTDITAVTTTDRFAVTDAARVEISNCILIMTTTENGSPYRAFSFNGRFELTGSSQFAIYNNTFTQSAGTASGPDGFQTGITFLDLVTLRDTSILQISDNTATFTTRRAHKIRLVYFDSIVLTVNSKLIQSNNFFNATGALVVTQETEYAFTAVVGSIQMSGSSSLQLLNNSHWVGVTDTTSSNVYFEFLNVIGVTMTGTSSIALNGNYYELSRNVGIQITMLFYFSTLTVAGGCVVSILNNVAKLSGGGTVEKLIQAMVYWPDTTISPSGYVAIEGNSISFDNSDRLNVVSRGWQTLLYTASQIEVSGNLSLSNNTITFTHDSRTSVNTMWYAGFSLYNLNVIGPAATVLIEGNRVGMETGDAGAAGVPFKVVRLAGLFSMNGGAGGGKGCTFRVANNTATISEFSLNTIANTSLLLVDLTGSSSFTQGSSLQIEGNTFNINGVGTLGFTSVDLSVIAIFKVDVATTLDRSQWIINTNILRVGPTRTSGNSYIQITGSAATITLTNFAKLDISENYVDVTGTHFIEGGWVSLSVLLSTQSLSITNSNLSVVYNTLVSSGSRSGTVGGGISTMLVNVNGNLVGNVGARSTLSSNYLNISTTSLPAISKVFRGFKFGAFEVSSFNVVMKVSSNTIHAQAPVLLFDITTVIGGGIQENVIENNLMFVSQPDSFLLWSMNHMGSLDLTLVSTCNNSIGGQPCVRHPTTGAYPCIMNVSTIFTVDDCSTRTASHSPSPTVSIPATPSPPSTPTVSLIRTRTRTPTPSLPLTASATIHPTATQSDQHTSTPSHTTTASQSCNTNSIINTASATNAITLSTSHTLGTLSMSRTPSISLTPTLPHTPTNTMPVPSCPSNCSHITYISTTAATPSRTGEYCNAANRSILSFSSEDVARAEGVKMWVWLARPPWLRINTTYTSISLLSTPMSTALRSLGVWASFTWMSSRDGVAVVLQGGDGNLLHDTEGTVTLPPSMFDCDTDGHTPQFTIVITGAPPILSGAEQTAVTVVSAVSAMSSADLQTVAAMGLSRCSPSGGNSTPAIRALVPIALNEACDGAVQGALLGIGVTAVCAVGAAVVLRALGRVDSMRDAVIRVRVPSVVLVVATLLQMGLTTCGARLFVDGDNGLGVVGMLVGTLLLPLNPLLAYTVASRQCYALTPTSLVPGGSMGQFMVRWFVSRTELNSNFYPPLYAQVVGRWVRPSSIWTCLVPITPVLMLACTLASGTTCRPIFLIASVGYGMVAVVFIVFRPHRQFMANYTQALALGLNAASLAVSSQIAQDPFNAGIGSASRALAMAQTGLSVVRLLHSGLGFLAFRLRREQWLQRSGKGPLFEYIAPCGGHNSSKGDDLDGDHVPLIILPNNNHQAFQPLVDDMGDDMIALLSREGSSVSNSSTSSTNGDGIKNEDEMVDEILERVAERHAQLTGHGDNRNDDITSDEELLIERE